MRGGEPRLPRSRAALPAALPASCKTCCSDLGAVVFQAFAFQKDLENVPEQLNIAPVEAVPLTCLCSANILRGPAACQALVTGSARQGRWRGRCLLGGGQAGPGAAGTHSKDTGPTRGLLGGEPPVATWPGLHRVGAVPPGAERQARAWTPGPWEAAPPCRRPLGAIDGFGAGE